MANTQAMCTSFKVDILNGVHAFGAAPIRSVTTKDAFWAALYFTTATINAGTTAYTTTGEPPTGGNYTAGGVQVTTATAPAASGTAAIFTPSASIQYTTITIGTAFDCVLIYNATQSNKAVSVHTFGAQTITAGTLTLTMPAGGLGTSLIQIT